MTKERRRELEARVIANRKREPSPFTIIPARSDWATDTQHAARRPPHRRQEHTDDTWCNARKRRP